MCVYDRAACVPVVDCGARSLMVRMNERPAPQPGPVHSMSTQMTNELKAKSKPSKKGNDNPGDGVVTNLTAIVVCLVCPATYEAVSTCEQDMPEGAPTGSLSKQLQATFTIVNAFTGISFLSMAYCFAISGWAAALMVPIVGVFYAYTGVLLTKATARYIDDFGSMPSISTLCMHVFAARGEAIFTYLVGLELVFVLICFLIVSCNIGALLVPSLTESDATILILTVSFACNFLPSHGWLSYFSGLGILSAFFIAGMFGFQLITQGSAVVHPVVSAPSRHGMIDALPIVLGAFSGHQIIPSIVSRMRENSRSVNVTSTLWISFAIVSCIYVALGGLGYALFGSSTHVLITSELVTSRFRGAHGSFVTVVLFVVLVKVLSVIPLVVTYSVDMWEVYCRIGFTSGMSRNKKHALLWLCCATIGLIYGHALSKLLSIIGLISLAISLVLPVFLYLRICGPFSPAKQWWLYSLIVFSTGVATYVVTRHFAGYAQQEDDFNTRGTPPSVARQNAIPINWASGTQDAVTQEWHNTQQWRRDVQNSAMECHTRMGYLVTTIEELPYEIADVSTNVSKVCGEYPCLEMPFDVCRSATKLRFSSAIYINSTRPQTWTYSVNVSDSFQSGDKILGSRISCLDSDGVEILYPPLYLHHMHLTRGKNFHMFAVHGEMYEPGDSAIDHSIGYYRPLPDGHVYHYEPHTSTTMHLATGIIQDVRPNEMLANGRTLLQFTINYEFDLKDPSDSNPHAAASMLWVHNPIPGGKYSPLSLYQRVPVDSTGFVMWWEAKWPPYAGRLLSNSFVHSHRAWFDRVFVLGAPPAVVHCAELGIIEIDPEHHYARDLASFYDAMDSREDLICSSAPNPQDVFMDGVYYAAKNQFQCVDNFTFNAGDRFTTFGTFRNRWSTSETVFPEHLNVFMFVELPSVELSFDMEAAHRDPTGHASHILQIHKNHSTSIPFDQCVAEKRADYSLFPAALVSYCKTYVVLANQYSYLVSCSLLIIGMVYMANVKQNASRVSTV